MQAKNRAAGLASLIFLIPGVSPGQAPAKLEFEVASVRPSGPAAQSGGGGIADARAFMANQSSEKGGPGTDDPERLAIRRTPLHALLFKAYGIRPDQISGPEWLNTELFDITAKIAPGTTKEQANVMLQNLLLERFKIVLHHATQDLPAYQVTVAKTGSKLKEMAPAPDSTKPQPGEFLFHQPESDSSGFPVLPEGRTGILAIRNKDGLNLMTCRACSVAELISRITLVLAVPFGSPGSPYLMAGRVTNKTGLTGTYAFHLEYSGETGSGGALPPPSLDGQGGSGPDIFTAFEKQLGLKLEKVKVPLDVLVIDQIEKVPTEN
jgi:uncharacterized protein (TIGR03435 family)